MQALFFAVKAGDVAGVRLLLENGARTDIQLPAELGALTPLHIAAALPGEEGVRITELLLHTVTDVDARVADEDDVYKPSKLDLLPSSLKLNNEAGPAGIYHSRPTCVPDEGGRTALHVACEREDSYKIDRLVDHGADILTPVTLTQGDKVAVGTAVDYGYFRFYQDRKIAHSPFYALTPVDREVLLARKQILEHMGFQLRRAVFAKESQWDPKVLYLSKRADPLPQAEAEKHRAVQGAPLGGAGAVSGRGRPRAGRCDRPGPLPRAALLRLSPEQHGPWLGSRVPSWSGPTSQRHLCWCRPAPLRPSRPLPHPLLLEVMAPQPPGLSRTISL
ncbi:radial spoke head 1 homolog [Lynx pardinus]|uniref:Radial spoke head 1 homolog n=1 Tax=Lynx pardinus TaxID=191816 RepID=A0A485P5K2_LYNPA|nr:radial spoke head 1 homolog [Lynx pardinus]